MMEIGPVQMLALSFDADAEFEGKIIAELIRLQRESTIRLLDLMVLGVDAETGEPVEIAFKDRHVGSIVGPLLGLDAAEMEPRGSSDAALTIADAYGLTVDEIRALARSIEPGSVMTLLLFEHIWARDLKQAIIATGGSVAGDGLLNREAVESVAPEVQEIADEMDAIIRELEEE